jgi:hypothetical protein
MSDTGSVYPQAWNAVIETVRAIETNPTCTGTT